MTALAKRTTALIVTLALGIAGAAATALAAENDALQPAWRVEIGKGPINQAPVVVGDTVLVIPNDGPLLALDATTGSQRWRFAPSEGLWSRALASDGQRVYVCLKNGQLAALAGKDGSLLWKTNLGINCQRPTRVSHGTLYVATTFVGEGLANDTFTGAKLFAINPADGKIIWAFTTDNYLLQVPYREDGTVYVGGSYYQTDVDVDEGGTIRFYALDSETGQPKWTYESHDGLPKALYATRQRLVYVAYQDYLVGLDAATGERVWRRDTGNWVPSLSGLGDVVYYGAANTFVHAWNVSDGSPKWKFNIPGESFNYLMGTPVFADGRMYFISQRGTIFALNQDDGTEVFAYPMTLKTRVGLSVSGKNLYLGDSDGNVYAWRVLK